MPANNQYNRVKQLIKDREARKAVELSKEGIKQCNCCYEELTVDNFSPNLRSKDGRQNICKKCYHIKYNANRVDKTKDEYMAIAKFNKEHRAGLLKEYTDSQPQEQMSKSYSYKELLEKQVKENKLDKRDMFSSLSKQRNYSGLKEHSC